MNEREKVITENMDLVKTVILNNIFYNRNTPLLEFDDLYQIGCLALCEAYDTFNGSVKFRTYAGKVVRNRLIDYCRKMNRIQKNICHLDNSVPDSDDMCYENIMSDENDSPQPFLDDSEIAKLFQKTKQNYSGITLKGIEALELKLKGYSGVEIAALYGVAPNLLAAWISRAKQKLRNDTGFVDAFLNHC